jgi:hypothetical protein
MASLAPNKPRYGLFESGGRESTTDRAINTAPPWDDTSNRVEPN